jgi:hypothetical protein
VRQEKKVAFTLRETFFLLPYFCSTPPSTPPADLPKSLKSGNLYVKSYKKQLTIQGEGVESFTMLSKQEFTEDFNGEPAARS